MASTTNVYSSKPAPISNPTRRTSFNTNTSRNSEVDAEENAKSRQSSLLSSEWKQIIIGKLDEFENRLRQNKRVSLFENKYFGRRLPLSYILASILLFSVISVLYVLSGMRLLTTIVGVMYPFYMSLKVLNAQHSNKLDEREWLSYWIWYGVFTSIENISGVFFFWMGNMYEIFKMALFVYLYHPQTRGSLFLYNKILQPLVIQLIRYEDVMLENVDALRKNISISEHDGNNNIQDQNFNNNMTNTSVNTSKNFGGNSNINSNNIGMNNLPLFSNSSIGANGPFNVNPNTLNTLNTLNTGNIPSTFVPFTVTTPLTANDINILSNPPVISAAPINPSNLATMNPNANYTPVQNFTQ